MRNLHRVVSAAVIAVVNLSSFVIGVAACQLFESAPRSLIQIPVSYAIGLAGVLVWFVLFRRFHKLIPETDYMIVFLLAFPLGAVFFTCVHFVVTGYLTSFGNIGGIWAIQFAENVVAVAVATAIMRKVDSAGGTAASPRSENDLTRSSG